MPDRNLNDLLHDIRDLFKARTMGNLDPKNYSKFGSDAATSALTGIHREERVRPPNTVYASELGTKCVRQHWYKANKPELAEPMGPSAKLKFLYGNLIEHLILLLAKEAGHAVSYEQELLDHVTEKGTTIRGRIDAVIDGEIVDVKSASPTAFMKMADKSTWDDPFGYKNQLGFYVTKAPRVYAREARFLLVNKVSGEMAFSYLPPEGVREGYLHAKADDLVANSSTPEPPAFRFGAERHPKGSVLCLSCSYCAFKRECWKDANGGTGLDARRYAKEVLFFVSTNDKSPSFEARKLTNEEEGKVVNPESSSGTVQK